MAGSDDVEVRFGSNTSDLNSGADSAKDAISGIGGSVEELKQNFENLAEAIGVAFAIDKLEEFTTSMSDLGEQVERTAKMTGLSTDEVQKFQFAVQLTGGDAENASTSLIRLERNIANAAAGSKEAKTAMENVGVSLDALKRGDVNEILGQMADKFSKTADGANKTGAAMAAAGRGGAQLIPILDEGREGLANLAQAEDETQSKLGPLAEKFAETSEQIHLMNDAGVGVQETLFSILEPSINAVIVAMTEMREEFTSSIKEGGALAQTIEFLGDVLDGTVAAVRILATGFTQFFDIASGIIKSISDEMQGLGDVMYDVIHLKLIKATEDWAAANAKATGDLKKGFEDADAAGQKLWEDMKRMMDVSQGAAVGLPKGKGGKKGKFDVADIKDKDAAGDDADKDRQLYAEQYNVKKEYDDLMVESGKMSKKEEFADLADALSKENALIEESFADQLALYNKDSKEYQKVLDQKAIYEQKYLIESLKLQQAEAKEGAKAWTSAFNTIEKTFDQMLTGMLQGTQTFGQAFQRLAQNLVISLGEAIIKMGLNWAKLEIQKTLATSTGNAERLASTTSTAAEGAAAEKASTIGTINQDAAKAAAGAYSALAGIPIIGPIIAPVAAGVAFAAVSAFDSFDVGTDYVPKDMLAMVHKGEKIVPAASNKSGASPYTGGDDGGGQTHVHFNVQAMDHKSVSAFFNQHGDKIARSVMSSIRNGNRGGRNSLRG